MTTRYADDAGLNDVIGSNTRATRVLVADDRRLVRDAMKYLLEEAPDIVVVSEASDGAELLSRFASVRPDVTVLDALMGGSGNGGLLQAIRSLDPDARTLLVVASPDPLSVTMGIQAGATGCISKHAEPSDLYQAVRRVAAGRLHISSECRGAAIGLLLGVGTLSQREEEIVSLVAAGMTQKDIARELGIDSRTVWTYVSRAARKLGVSSNLELSLSAVRNHRLFT